MYEGLDEPLRDQLRDTLATQGIRAYLAARKSLDDQLVFSLAEQCDPYLSSRMSDVAALGNAYFDMRTSLAVLESFGVTEQQLDAVRGPRIDVFRADIRASNLELLRNEPRKAPPTDDPLVIDEFKERLSLPEGQRVAWGSALVAYYAGKDAVELLDQTMKP